MKKIKEIYLYMLLFAVIYIEFGYQMVVTKQLSGFTRMIILLLLTLPVMFFKRKISSNSVVGFLLVVLYVVANSFRDGNFVDCILLLIPIIVGFIIATGIDINEYITIYSNIMFFLAIYSLVIYCVNLIVPSVIQGLPYLGTVYTSLAEIHNAFFSVAITNSINVRNYGIAWEPGAFSLLICWALLFEMSFYKTINYKRAVIYIITIVTTFSTTGYIAMIGILYATFLYKRKVSRRERNVLLIIILSIVLFVCFSPEKITELVFAKLNGLFNGETVELAYTTQSRVNAIKYPVQAFLSSPLIGVGYEQFSIVNKTLCDSVATNTIINWYAVLGALFGLPCSVALFRFLCQITKRIKAPKFNAFIICISVVLLLSTESLLRISLVYVMVFWGIQKKIIINKELIKR